MQREQRTCLYGLPPHSIQEQMDLVRLQERVLLRDHFFQIYRDGRPAASRMAEAIVHQAF